MDESTETPSDRHGIVDTLMRYALYLDAFDFDSLAGLFTDDVSFAARFINLDAPPENHPESLQASAPPVIAGRDQLMQFIQMMTADLSWQQHTLNVYDVQVTADEATATTYMTSFKTRRANRSEVVVVVARYRDELRKLQDKWLIGRKQMDVGWTETRQANTSDLAAAYAARSRELAESASAADGRPC
jgi:hypothetical protein